MISGKTFSLILPPSTSDPAIPNVIESNGSIVIVGANGSGKTRLGSWLELNSSDEQKVHRIAAQKSLMMPEQTSTATLEKAEAALWYGNENAQNNYAAHKRGSRWGGNPDTYLLSDFDRLLILLFSQDYEVSNQYRQQVQAANSFIAPPKTKLDLVKEIWEEILPHRQLQIHAGTIRVKAVNSPSYNGAAMSDGERVIFYLLGQCLAAPPNAIIIIDEPEIHLHKSIQSTLWDAIEAKRSDCLFVYLTHDLDFAASRAGATKIWIQGYENSSWAWQLVPENTGVPEALLLSVLGSRKPVLFTEGDTGSLDYFVFSHLYPNFTITPCGGCEQVIHTTQALNTFKQMHRLECRGIVDQDYRSASDIQWLNQREISVLTLSEIENLFLLEGVLRAVATELARQDTDAIVENVKNMVFTDMRRNKEQWVSAMSAASIERGLSRLDAKAQGVSALTTSVQNLFQNIDVQAIYSAAEQRLDTIVSNRDYEEALKIYNNKGLLYQVGTHYGLKAAEYISFVKRLIEIGRGQSILTAMQQFVPNIPV